MLKYKTWLYFLNCSILYKKSRLFTVTVFLRKFIIIFSIPVKVNALKFIAFYAVYNAFQDIYPGQFLTESNLFKKFIPNIFAIIHSIKMNLFQNFF